jgi:hypothetical protein
MEVEGAVILYTMAGLMVTFAGFSALLLALRQAAGGHLSRLDRYLAKTVLTQLFLLSAGALLPPVIALYDTPDTWVWRISAVLFALPMLYLLLSYPHRRRKVIGHGPPLMVLVIFVVFGSAAIIAMLVYVLSGLQHSAAAYISALAINFFTTAFAFVTALDVIMQQPVDASKRTSPGNE